MSGSIYKTTNAGEDWILKSSGTAINLNSVFFIDNNNGFAAGLDGIILKSTDGGENWSIKPSGTTHDLLSVYFTDVNSGWTSGFAHSDRS